MLDKSSEHAILKGRIFATARDPQGNVKWREEVFNLHTNEGLDNILDVYFAGTSPPTDFFIGLTASTPTFAVGDTMAAHAGWTENTTYDEATRELWSPDAVSAQAISNTTTVASFTISTGGTTVGGAFFTTDSTKGGTTGTLVSGSAFGGGDRVLAAADTLEIEYEQAAS